VSEPQKPAERPRLRLVPQVPPPSVAEAGAPAQTEMPFAIVEGEPVTELPRDLYIPPHALEVFLEAFEGPLDLLLYLIRRQNIDILDIPIAEISRQYVQYIDLMKEMQFELAGEYLVMGATLADGGVNPLTCEQVVDAVVCRYVLAVMTTAGLYETSGDWLYDVGLPGKSGIGGGIVTVSPGKCGLGTFAPLLDPAGNSVKGGLTTAWLSKRLGLDLFASEPWRALASGKVG